MKNYELLNLASDLRRVVRWVWENQKERRDLINKEWKKIQTNQDSRNILHKTGIKYSEIPFEELEDARQRTLFCDSALMACSRMIHFGLNSNNT